MESQDDIDAKMAAQAKAAAEAKAAQDTALGKVIQMVVDKLKEHMYDEIEYYSLRSKPIMMDK